MQRAPLPPLSPGGPPALGSAPRESRGADLRAGRSSGEWREKDRVMTAGPAGRCCGAGCHDTKLYKLLYRVKHVAKIFRIDY